MSSTSISPATAIEPRWRLPWPTLLGPIALADAQALDRLAIAREVADRDVVFACGQAADSLLILVDGQVVLGHAESGQPLKAERVLHGPAWLDLGSAWSGGRHAGDALAQSAVQMARLPVAALRGLLGQRPTLGLRFIERLACEVGRLGAQTHELMHMDAPTRLAAWLRRQIEGEPRAVLHLVERKRDIASQLGMTPETLSRLMRSLSERGLIAVDGYRVQVLDPRALARLAGA